jgi:hypothetical protein
MGNQDGKKKSTQDAEKNQNRYSINLNPRLSNCHRSNFQELAAPSRLHYTSTAIPSKRHWWVVR